MGKTPRVALVHDYLREYGDAERFLDVLHRLYPDAPVYTAFVDRSYPGGAAERFASWDIRPTISQHLPGVTHYYDALRPLLPYFWELLDLSEFDLVVSSSSGYLSKSILTPAQTLHINYCHTPPRYLWEMPKPENGIASYWINSRLRQYDFYASQRVDRFVTNSQRVARRIRKFYRRQAEVIPPPVTVRGEGQAGEDYYLYVGALTSNHRVDLAIQACDRLHRPLWVVGSGDEIQSLQKLAGPTVRFLDPASVGSMAEIYAGAKALIYPCTDEDFGILPVEAMGHGIPVIASAQSGLNEIVLDYRTGLLFQDPTVEGLMSAITKFEGLRFSSLACIERAQEFAEPVFISKLEWFVAQALDDHHVHGATVLG